MENITTCGLCLELIIKTEDFENWYCDEKQNLQILQNLGITVSKDGKICSNCVNISRLMYNFKTSCLANNDHLKTLVHPGINDKLILEEVMVEKSKSEFKNEKVCRFCLNFSEVNSLMEVNLQQDVVLKDMLERCLPEIDTKFVQNPLMCYICNRLLKKLYNFIAQCEDTEVFRNLDPKTDVLVNENTSTPTVENNDKNINESFAKEENYDGIESPELEIKSEDFDINEDFKDSIKERNPVAGKDVTPKPRGTIKEKKFVCDICSYQTISKFRAKRHYLIHKKPSEVNLFKCNYCSFATKWRGCLARHEIRHHYPSNLPKFKCNDCPYETNIKENLVSHVQVKHLRHHKEGKQPAKSNQNLKKVRQRRKHNPVEEKAWKPKPRGTIKEKKFVCDICSYRTNRNDDLKDHCVIHKDASEVNLFKCDYCPFATKWKRSLRGHTIHHQNPSKLPKFKCNDCPYRTNIRRHLVCHVQVHKNHSQVNTYKCEVCPFQTKYKISIQLHEKRHQAVIYTSDECNYTSILETRFLRYLRHHKEEKHPAKSNQNLKEARQDNSVEEIDVKPKPCGTIEKKKFVCDICSYRTNIRYLLKRHCLVHKEPSEVNLFKCDYCPFATKWKKSLTRHTMCHKNASNLPKFKCNDCPFETCHKENLVKHILVHKTPSQVKMYKCRVCPLQTKYKCNIKKHEEKHQVDTQLVV